MEDAIRIIEGLDTSNSEENIEAKKMAVAAMKKQIPKKVIKKEYEGEEITGYLFPYDITLSSISSILLSDTSSAHVPSSSPPS